MEVNMENVCRTCLGLSGLLSIYDSNSDGSIAIMLSGFTKIKPAKGDSLPEKVCLSCISEINHCYTFMLKCENSNRTLRQLLPDAPPEEVEVAKSVRSRPLMCSKSVQTNVEKRSELTSTEVQTMDQQVLIECDIRNELNTITEIVQTKDIDNSVVSNSKVENMLVTDPADESDELDDGELVFKRFPVDEQNENEIILELLDKRDAGITKKIDSKEIRKKRNYTESEAYIEIDNASFEYNSIDDEIHYKKRCLKTDSSLTEILEEHVNEEAVEELFLENEGAQESDFNFTVYEEYGETKVVPRRPMTRSCKVNSTTKPKFKCPECTMSFTSEKLLNRHSFKKHIWNNSPEKSTAEEEEKSPSTSIKENVTTPAKLDKELKENEKSKKNSSVIRTESDSDTVKLKYFCERCNAGFALCKSLNYHRQLKSCTMKSFKCDKCERVFISDDHLKEHRFTHVLANTCGECHKVFTSADSLSQHMVDEHKRNLRNQCKICKKVFTMTSALRDHLRTHSGEKPFLCPVCGKGFSQNANLKQHVMRHTKEKNFKCNQCTNSFVTKAELVSHMRRHTGDAPFKCEYCSGSFTTSSSLMKHRRKHTGERPYACDICPMRFAALNVLKNHRRTHTGEKPYTCMYCGKAFTQKGDCHIHQRSHTEKLNTEKTKKVYTCPCGKKFSHLNCWRSHNCDKSTRKILNSAATTTSLKNAMHAAIFESDISNEESTVLGTEDLTQGQSGEEEIMQMDIEMC